MTDHSAFDDEYRFFGDVRGVIGDALEAATDLHEPQRAFDGCGVGHHVGHQDAEDRVAHRIGAVFPREDRLRGEAAFSRLTMDIWELVRDAAVKAIET